MARFYFNVHDGQLVEDPEGLELASLDAARDHALVCARGIMADDIRCGELALDEIIDIIDDGGKLVATIAFRDALIIR